MFGYKFVKIEEIKKQELKILELQDKIKNMENIMRTKRSYSRDFYGENSRLRLEVDVLKKEIEKLKKELVEKENKENKQITETPKKKRVNNRKRKIETK